MATQLGLLLIPARLHRWGGQDGEGPVDRLGLVVGVVAGLLGPLSAGASPQVVTKNRKCSSQSMSQIFDVAVTKDTGGPDEDEGMVRSTPKGAGTFTFAVTGGTGTFTSARVTATITSSPETRLDDPVPHALGGGPEPERPSSVRRRTIDHAGRA
jgi:hypothetical protein